MDNVRMDCSPSIASLLNYSRRSELSDVNLIPTSALGSYLSPLENIENETILSKNTNESLNRVLEQLSLLREVRQDCTVIEYCINESDASLLSNDSDISTDVKQIKLSSDSRKQNKYLTDAVNDEFISFDELSNKSFIKHNNVINDFESIDESIITCPKIMNTGKLEKDSSYTALEKFIDFSNSECQDDFQIQKMNNKSILVGSWANQSNTNCAIADVYKQSDSPRHSYKVNGLTTFKYLNIETKTNANYTKNTFLDNIKCAQTKFKIIKEQLLKNNSKLHDITIDDVLEDNKDDSNVKFERNYSSICLDSLKELCVTMSIRRCDETNHVSSSDISIYPKTNKSNIQVANKIKKLKNKDGNDIIEYFNGSDSNPYGDTFLIHKVNSSNPYKTFVVDISKNDIKTQIKGCNHVIKVFELVNDSVIKQYNEYNCESNNIINISRQDMSFNLNGTTLECHSNKSSFYRNVNNNHLEEIFCENSIFETTVTKQDENFIRILKLNINTFRKITSNEKKDKKKEFNSYITQSNKREIEITKINEIVPLKSMLQKSYKSGNFQQNTDIHCISHYSDKSSSKNSIKKAINTSDRISARLRKKIRPKMTKCKTSLDKITELEIRKVVCKLILKKSSYRLTSNKNNITGKKRKCNNKNYQDKNNIKVRLRKKIPASQLKSKMNFKRKERRKHLISKIQSSCSYSSFIDYEDIIEKINSIINGAGCKRTNVNVALKKLLNIINEYTIYTSVIEFYTFVMNYTPLYFQEKIIPLNGAFHCTSPYIRKKLSDLLTDI